jgi:hypothetical protein
MGLTGVKRSADEWTGIINDYKRSGMSLRAYAKEHGINLKTLSNHTKSNHSRIKNQVGKKHSLDEWKALFRDQAASGLSIEVWCEEKGISACAMHSAKRRIKQSCGQTSRQWARVQLSGANTNSTLGAGQVTIRFSGIEIEADETYSAENIVALVEGLRRQ